MPRGRSKRDQDGAASASPTKKPNGNGATLGFEEAAQLDDGDLWVTSLALKALTPETEKTITDYVRRAAGG